MKWLDALESLGATEDYLAHLQRRRDDLQRQQDTAPSWEAAKQALGGKLALDNLIADLTRSKKEGAAHAEYLRRTR